MQRNLLILGLVLLTTTSGFGINRRMMEDKTMVGFQANFMPSMELYQHAYDEGKFFGPAVGGGLRGKYFGTNTFAFGFDFSFFAPKISSSIVTWVADSVLRSGLSREQVLQRIPDSIRILDVTSSAQYIPFNISFEFYLPKYAFTNFRPYVGLGLGLNIINARYKATYNALKLAETGIPEFEKRVQPSFNKGI